MVEGVPLSGRGVQLAGTRRPDDVGWIIEGATGRFGNRRIITQAGGPRFVAIAVAGPSTFAFPFGVAAESVVTLPRLLLVLAGGGAVSTGIQVGSR